MTDPPGGGTIRVRAWQEDGRIVVDATIVGSERDGSSVLADCVLTPA